MTILLACESQKEVTEEADVLPFLTEWACFWSLGAAGIVSTYEVRGMRQTLTSYDNQAVGSGSILNDNAFVYNDFSQLTTEYQSHAGAVNMSTTAKVQYGYATGSANTIRATNLVYPNGRVLTYSYGSAGSQSDRLSRVASYIDDDGTSHIVDYSYVGTLSFVEGDRPQPQMKWTLIDLSGTNDPDTGDIYTGLDRFGRVKDNRWYGYGTSSDLDRIQYGYDRAGNRIWRRNTVAAALGKEFDEIYSYDGVHRLKDMVRGLLNTNRTALTSTTFAQCWTLDATGNWSGFREDDTGDGTWDLVQARTANDVNEITGITNSVGASWVQPAYSPAGNMTTMPQPNDPTKGYTATYDAWNRLVKTVDTPTSNIVGEYTYDGARRQIRQKNYDSGTLTETRHLYYTDPATWRCLEERLGTSPDTASPDRQFVWGSRYIDDLILRDRAVISPSSSSSSGGGPNPLGERLFVCQDANWNVTAITCRQGQTQRRVCYSSYGSPTFLTSACEQSDTLFTDFEHLYCCYRMGISTAVYYARHRHYLSECGLWTTRDTQNGINLYEYENPINSVDPFGLSPLAPSATAAQAIIVTTTQTLLRISPLCVAAPWLCVYLFVVIVIVVVVVVVNMPDPNPKPRKTRRPRDCDDDECDCWCVGYQGGVHGRPTNLGMMSKEDCLAASQIFEQPDEVPYEEQCACGEGWWRLD